MSKFYDAYRDDEELYVYDQDCSNCANHGTCLCPMYLSDEETDERKIKAVERKRKEDAVTHSGEIDWCIYWKQKRGGHKGRGSKGGYR